MRDVRTRTMPEDEHERHAQPPPLGVRVVQYPKSALLGTAFVIRDTLTIGREAGPDVELSLNEDAMLSRKHVQLSMEQDAIAVVDLGSKNGVYVDGQRVNGSVRVRRNGVIRIGATLMVVDAIAPVRTTPSCVADSFALCQALSELDAVATSKLPVLLAGQTGTGKDVLALALHEASAAPGAFVPINCAALQENLAEATLFGHKKGAFTGALADVIGQIEAAKDGTLFLDEVADLPLAIQAKMLRVLETGDYFAVGATELSQARVRVVAASNASMTARVSSGAFRADLYARLSGAIVQVPVLAERRADILPLARKFWREATPARPFGLGAADCERLLLFPWPLNVRQLRNAVHRAAVTAEQRGAPSLILDASVEPRETQTATPAPESARRNWHAMAMTAELFEKTVRELKGNVARVSQVFNTDRKQIYRWAKKFNVDLGELR